MSKPPEFPAATMRDAVHDLSWLLSRRYAVRGALKVVGDRYQLEAPAREAVRRAAAPDGSVRSRKERQVHEVGGQTLHLDGFNVLAIVLSAHVGRPVFRGRDGALRDLAGLAGRFRVNDELTTVIETITRAIHELGVERCVWYFDAPVSNSGRISQLVRTIGESCNLNCDAEVVPDPDHVVGDRGGVCASSDSAVLDRCGQWYNLAEHVIETKLPNFGIIDLAKDVPTND